MLRTSFFLVLVSIVMAVATLITADHGCIHFDANEYTCVNSGNGNCSWCSIAWRGCCVDKVGYSSDTCTCNRGDSESKDWPVDLIITVGASAGATFFCVCACCLIRRFFCVQTTEPFVMEQTTAAANPVMFIRTPNGQMQPIDPNITGVPPPHMMMMMVHQQQQQQQQQQSQTGFTFSTGDTSSMPTIENPPSSFPSFPQATDWSSVIPQNETQSYNYPETMVAYDQ
jgi:hypothetical protein